MVITFVVVTRLLHFRLELSHHSCCDQVEEIDASGLRPKTHVSEKHRGKEEKKEVRFSVRAGEFERSLLVLVRDPVCTEFER